MIFVGNDVIKHKMTSFHRHLGFQKKSENNENYSYRFIYFCNLKKKTRQNTELSQKVDFWSDLHVTE